MCTALAHPARRQILLAVQFCGGEANAGYIAERFSCSWPTVSRHLGVLEKAGLLVPERQGRERIYRMNKDALAVLNEWLAWFEQPPA
ncbi:MAG: metalloregulator ArsR/SmtB family transcription factor [Rhizomicrobium sp.]